jgi:pimeloyl-ACP methyl ester carboxylesterase
MKTRNFYIFLSLLFFILSGCANQQNIKLTADTYQNQQSLENNSWYSISNSDTVFIFVHGIFSNSAKCWSSPSGAYWPEILSKDSRFENPSIFLGGYYTESSSGQYDIPNAAYELLSHLRVKDVKGNPPPLAKPKLIFIAHSTGGLVVRYLLERYQDLFKDKTVGLVLLASPSKGSAWANRLQWLRKLYGNKMAGQLEVNSEFLNELNSRFSDLVNKQKPLWLIGIDAFENKFIIPGWLFNSEYVVSAEDSTSYFGGSKIIPNSDHFSIAKPNSASDPSHQLLWDFYDTSFRPMKARNWPEVYEELARSYGNDTFLNRIFWLTREPGASISLGPCPGEKCLEFELGGLKLTDGALVQTINLKGDGFGIKRPPNSKVLFEMDSPFRVKGAGLLMGIYDNSLAVKMGLHRDSTFEMFAPHANIKFTVIDVMSDTLRIKLEVSPPNRSSLPPEFRGTGSQTK